MEAVCSQVMVYGRITLSLILNSVEASAILESAALGGETYQWRAGAFQPPAGGTFEVLSTLRTNARCLPASPAERSRRRRIGGRRGCLPAGDGRWLCAPCQPLDHCYSGPGRRRSTLGKRKSPRMAEARAPARWHHPSRSSPPRLAPWRKPGQDLRGQPERRRKKIGGGERSPPPSGLVTACARFRTPAGRQTVR